MELVTFVLLFLIAVLPIVYRYKSDKKYRELVKVMAQIPGDRWYPIIGSQWRFIKAGRKGVFNAAQDRCKEYGSIFKYWMGNKPVITTFKPEHLQIILSSRTNINKSELYDFFSIIDKGILVAGGDFWRKDRKMIGPSFHLQMLDKFMDCFNENARIFTNKLAAFANTGEFVNLLPMAEQLAFDIIGETAMGVKLNSQQGQNMKYLHGVLDIFEACVARLFNPFIHSNLAFYLSSAGPEYRKNEQILKEFVEFLVKSRKQRLQNIENNNSGDGLKDDDERQKKIMLDVILEALGSTPERDDHWILSQVVTMILAGLDTTSVSISLILFALASNPDVQEKVYQEITETLHGNSDEDISNAHINQMTYLDMAIKESLRMYAIVPAFARNLDEPVVLDGLTIPTGTTITCQVYALHHDPTIYPEPEKFDPERFSPEAVAQRHPYSYIPFSAGHRNCVGLRFSRRSVRICLAHLLRRYRVEAKIKPEELEFEMDLAIKPRGGMYLRFYERAAPAS